MLVSKYDLPKVVNIQDVKESLLPHVVSEVICVHCCHRWVAARPEGTLLRSLECPNCGPGAVIETGECIDNLLESLED